MKKIFTLILATLALSFSLQAQDARGRTVETIVGDVLAQMPAQNATTGRSRNGNPGRDGRRSC